MTDKTHKTDAEDKANPQFSDAIKDSAQQIWQAGLGAFAKAQQEGGKMFEALVKEGASMQRKTQAATEEKVAEATSRVSDLASDIQAKAGTQWDKLENIFEERVAKALGKLGVPTMHDVNLLSARIEALEKRLQKLDGDATATRPPPTPEVPPAATTQP